MKQLIFHYLSFEINYLKLGDVQMTFLCIYPLRTNKHGEHNVKYNDNKVCQLTTPVIGGIAS